MSYEDKTKLYTWKEMSTVLKALSKLEKESKSIKNLLKRYNFQNLNESIRQTKNSNIITYSIDQFGKPYVYSDSPLVDDCVHALKIVKKLQSQNTNKELGEANE